MEVNDFGDTADKNLSEYPGTSEILPTECNKFFHFPSIAEQSTVPVEIVCLKYFCLGSLAQKGLTRALT